MSKACIATISERRVGATFQTTIRLEYTGVRNELVTGVV